MKLYATSVGGDSTRGGGGGDGRGVARSDGSGSRPVESSTIAEVAGGKWELILKDGATVAKGLGIGAGIAADTFLLVAAAVGLPILTYHSGTVVNGSLEAEMLADAQAEEARRAAAAAASKYAARAGRRALAAAAVAAIAAKNLPVLLCRVGGASADKLQLSAGDRSGTPMGLSVLAVESPRDAVMAFRAIWASKNMANNKKSFLVGVTTLAQIRAAGFDAVPSETDNFLNHWTITHPAGEAGFNPENLKNLASKFVDVPVP